MSFKISGARRGGDHGAAHPIEQGSHGGLLATILSAFALVISGLSYYESTMKSAELSVYVPPMIHYARDGRDVFNVPITIANDGARNGTVLTMELDVENLRQGAERKSRRFHAAFIGEYPQGEQKVANRSFAPLAIAGHSTFTETVRFYPMDDEEGVLVDDKGDFRFTLKLLTAKAEDPGLLDAAFRTDPKPLTFELNLPYLAIQHLAFRNGTVPLFNKNWRPAVSTNTESAVSARKSPSSAPKDAAPEPESGSEAPAPNR